MKYVRTFETFDDFLATQEAVSGSGKYVEDIFPGFAYVKENYPESLYAFFNGHEEPAPEGYVFGDVIYYDGPVEEGGDELNPPISDFPVANSVMPRVLGAGAGESHLKSIFWSAFTPSMGIPVGVIVADASMTPDGIARMVALENYSCNDIVGNVQDGMKGETRSTSSEESEKKPFMRRVGPKVFTTEKKEEEETKEEGGENLLKATKAEVESLPKPDGYWFTPYYSYDAVDQDQYWYNGFMYHCGDEEEKDKGGSKGISVSEEYPAPTGTCFINYYNCGGGPASSDYPGAYYDYPYTNTLAPGEYYDDESNSYYTVSPYTTEEGVLSQAYLTESGMDENNSTVWNALSDFSGRTWTKMMNDIGSEGFCGAVYEDYKTSGTQYGDWYVPSLGESMLMAARLNSLSQIFEHLGYQGICDYDGLITSTVLNGECGFGFASWFYGNFGKGHYSGMIAQIKDGNWASYDYHVRPMAMIEDGQIVRTLGTPVANGHQIKDIYSPDMQE